jgi:hypothetical protein
MIQIIDGFNLQTPTPIDSRIVVSDDTERLAITSKYHGLRVWEQDTNTPYFWDGSTWVSELDLVVTGQGTDDFIPKFKSSNPTEIEDSQISDDGNLVNISNDLKVSNEVTATTFLGNLDSSYLTGTIGLDKISTVGGISDNVLRLVDISGVLVPQWVDISGISIGSSNSTEKVNLKKVVSTNYYSLIVRDTANTLNSTGGTNMDLFTYETDLIISEDSGGVCILAHQGSKDNPPYSFYDTTSNNILGGIYSDNSVSVSYSNTQVGRFDSSGFKTIDGSESSPSISFIDDTNTGIYRPSDDVISFSTDGNETVRMDTNGFKTIFGSVTNPSIGFFGTKSIGVPGPPAGSVSIQNLDDTGFYGDVVFQSGTFMIKRLNFVTDGDNILNFNTYGLEVTDGVGSLTYPSIRFGQGIGFYKDGSSNLIIANGSTQAVSIATNRDVTIKKNLILPDPDGSDPSAASVLGAVDSTGKVEWKNLSSISAQSEAGQIPIQYLADTSKSVHNFESVYGFGKTQITPFVAPFNGYFNVTFNLSVHSNHTGLDNDLQFEVKERIYKNGVKQTESTRGYYNTDKTSYDNLYHMFRLNWCGYLNSGDKIQADIKRVHYFGTNGVYMYFGNGSKPWVSYISWFGNTII